MGTRAKTLQVKVRVPYCRLEQKGGLGGLYRGLSEPVFLHASLQLSNDTQLAQTSIICT